MTVITGTSEMHSTLNRWMRMLKSVLQRIAWEDSSVDENTETLSQVIDEIDAVLRASMNTPEALKAGKDGQK